MAFCRQEYWSGLPFPSPEEPPPLQPLGMEPMPFKSPALAGGFSTTSATWEAQNMRSVQFSSVAQLCPTHCDPMDCSRPGFPVHHQLLIQICLQFSSVTKLCLTLCNPMNHSTPGLPVHHQFPEFTQTHVH